MYTDETIMPYGGYRGYPIKNIPIKYFENVLKNKKDARPELIEYIMANAKRLNIAIPNYTPKLNLPKYVRAEDLIPFICDKKTFPTKKDAQNSLKTIRSVGGEHKKPQRAYECPKCSGWHLTSMDIEVFKEK